MGSILTILYIILILPTMLLYRTMEMAPTDTTDRRGDRMNLMNKKDPPLYQDGLF